MSYVNRQNVIVFVERSIPHEDLADFNMDAIADALIAEYPEVIGEHYLTEKYYYQVDRVDAFLSDSFDSTRFWEIMDANART